MGLGHCVIEPCTCTPIRQRTTTGAHPLVLGIELSHPLLSLGFKRSDGSVARGRLFGRSGFVVGHHQAQPLPLLLTNELFLVTGKRLLIDGIK